MILKIRNDRPDSLVGCTSDWYSGGRKFDLLVWQHSFVVIGHEIISSAILLLLIQVGHLSVTVVPACTWTSFFGDLFLLL